MFKSELKSGMVVVYRNGDARTVLKETQFGNMITSADRKVFASFDAYTEDLIHCGCGKDNPPDKKYDIMEVYAPVNKFRPLMDFNDKNFELVWKRKTVRTVTIADLVDNFGKDFVVLDLFGEVLIDSETI